MRQRFEKMLSDSSRSGRRRRSVAGASIALLVLPVLLGIMACLPVPVGDPERSRIDPALTGVWMSVSDEDMGLLVLAPYDRRTWLLLNAGVEGPEGIEVRSPGDVPFEELTISGGTLFKAWLTNIGGTRLMTWEPMLTLDEDRGLAPELWFVFRLFHGADDTLTLQLINPDYEDLGEVETRRQAEGIIRRNIDDPELFEDVDGDASLFRVPQSEYGAISDLLEDMGLEEW